MRGTLPLLRTGALIALLLPFGWAVAASLLPEVVWYGGEGAPGPTLEHYRALLAERDVLRPLRNSLVVASLTTFLAVPLGAACGYALARLRFPGRGAVAVALLVVSLLPQITLVNPLFLVLRWLGLIHSFPGLVLPYLTFALPLAVYLAGTTFRSLPAELEEAARLDGAGRLRALCLVLAPAAAPGLASAGLLTFLYCWNEFLFALSFTLGPERWTLPVAIAMLQGRYQIPWGQVLAASMLAALPVVAVAALLQRRVVEGLTAGAVRGGGS